MKVKELVQQLVKLPPDAEIGVKSQWNWTSVIERITPYPELYDADSVQNLWDCEYVIELN